MRKLLSLLVLCAMLVGFAGAETTREQKVERVSQALAAFQKGGQVWQGRLEVPDGLGILYLKYPGALVIDYDRGQDLRVVNDTAVWTNGNSEPFNENALWLLASGSLGQSVEIIMADHGPDPFYGSQSGVVVADLVSTNERAPKLNLRIYVSADGAPKLLGWGYSNQVWLRDFHPVTPAKDVFSVPKL